MLEGVFVTYLDEVDIDSDRVIGFYRFDKFTGYVIGRFKEILGFDIVVQELNTLTYTLDNLVAQGDLALILYTAFFN